MTWTKTYMKHVLRNTWESGI